MAFEWTNLGLNQPMTDRPKKKADQQLNTTNTASSTIQMRERIEDQHAVDIKRKWANQIESVHLKTKPKRKTQNHIRAFWGLVFSWCAGDKANCVVVVIIDCNLPKLTKEKNTFKLSLELKLKWKWKLKMMQSEMEESETITNTV